MEKLDTYSANLDNMANLDSMEDSYLQCIDPHQVSTPTVEYRLHFNVSTEQQQMRKSRVKSEEMEQFGDLAVFLPTNTTRSIDELNTPVFEQTAFDFPTQQQHNNAVHKSPFDYKFNQDLFDNLNPTKPNNFTGQLNNVQQSSSESSSPINSLIAATPLYLNVNVNTVPDILTNDSVIINTPDIISAVADMDNTFNILDIVKADEMRTVNLEDIFPFPNHNTTTTNSNKTQQQSKKRKHHSNNNSDDDSDYTPPWKQTNGQKGQKLLKHFKEDPQTSNSSSDDSDYELSLSKVRKSTKKRKTSDSSSDVSKYREVRDKNNEASRKSRLKRKQKEQEIETECSQLLDSNVKLRAQVEELEKTVNSYRNNLFSIMMKK